MSRKVVSILYFLLILQACTKEVYIYTPTPDPPDIRKEAYFDNEQEIIIEGNYYLPISLHIKANIPWRVIITDPVSNPWLYFKDENDNRVISTSGEGYKIVTLYIDELEIPVLREAQIELVSDGKVYRGMRIIQGGKSGRFYFQFDDFMGDELVTHADLIVDGKSYKDIPLYNGIVDRTLIEGDLLTSALFYTKNDFEDPYIVDWFDHSEGVVLPRDGKLTSLPIIKIPNTAGGDGKEESPYLISNIRQFRKLKEMRDSRWQTLYAKLTCDLDLKQYNNGREWDPIHMDRIHFDGDGHTISNMVIKKVNIEAVGLFSDVDYGSIKNLNIRDVEMAITTDEEKNFRIGAFVGDMRFGDMENCHASNVLIRLDYSGYSIVGGLVGRMNSVNLSNCSLSGDNSIDVSRSAGGICGAGAIKIENCFAEADIRANEVAGISVYCRSISQCYSSITASSKSNEFIVAGVQLHSNNLKIYNNCTLLKIITTPNSIAGYSGITDYNYYETEGIDFPYNLSKIDIVGNNCHDFELTEDWHYPSYHGTPTTLLDISKQSTFDNSTMKWDFDRIWEMSPIGDHPVLKNQIVK